jgi:hypothetical protein
MIPINVNEMSNSFIEEIKDMTNDDLLQKLMMEAAIIDPKFLTYLSMYSVAQAQFPSVDPKIIMSKYCFIAYLVNKIIKIKMLNIEPSLN